MNTREQAIEAAAKAEDAEERGAGICRTCLAPIWNEGGTIGRRHRPDEGWSDRNERGGDSLVCFRALDYRHVPLTGREAGIYDHAYALGAASPSVPVLLNDLADRIEAERLMDDTGDPEDGGYNCAISDAREIVRAAAEGWGQ